MKNHVTLENKVYAVPANLNKLVAELKTLNSCPRHWDLASHGMRGVFGWIPRCHSSLGCEIADRYVV
jgi:hypothetical protein